MLDALLDKRPTGLADEIAEREVFTDIAWLLRLQFVFEQQILPQLLALDSKAFPIGVKFIPNFPIED